MSGGPTTRTAYPHPYDRRALSMNNIQCKGARNGVSCAQPFCPSMPSLFQVNRLLQNPYSMQETQPSTSVPSSAI